MVNGTRSSSRLLVDRTIYTKKDTAVVLLYRLHKKKKKNMYSSVAVAGARYAGMIL